MKIIWLLLLSLPICAQTTINGGRSTLGVPVISAIAARVGKMPASVIFRLGSLIMSGLKKGMVVRMVESCAE
jgi:hypothetical protein